MYDGLSHFCPAEEPAAGAGAAGADSAQSRRELLPRRHTIAGSRPVLRHSDAMDLDVSNTWRDAWRDTWT